MTDQKRIEELNERLVRWSFESSTNPILALQGIVSDALALASELARAIDDAQERMGSLLVSPTEAVRSYAAEAARSAECDDISECLHAIGHLETIGLDLAVELAQDRAAKEEAEEELMRAKPRIQALEAELSDMKRELERERERVRSAKRLVEYGRVRSEIWFAEFLDQLGAALETSPPPPVPPVAAEEPVAGERCPECQGQGAVFVDEGWPYAECSGCQGTGRKAKAGEK